MSANLNNIINEIKLIHTKHNINNKLNSLNMSFDFSTFMSKREKLLAFSIPFSNLF